LHSHFFCALSGFSCAWRTFVYKDILVKWIALSSIFIPLKDSKYKYIKNRRKKAQGEEKAS